MKGNDFDALATANAPLNAFTDFDRHAASGIGALAGLTIGVKANIMVAGLPWTAGMEVHRHRIAQRDAATVAALRTAGAIIIGTTNMEEAALGATTNNPWFGATHNPHCHGFTAGGSSGGSAAAVAAGLCDAALGSDTMGSVRIPASYCGIYGFKPAHAAVSQDGLELAEPSLDTIGPMARDIDTLERLSRVISDFGEGDNNAPDTVAAGMVLSDLGGVDCTPDVQAVFDATAARLGVLQKVTLSVPLSRIRFAGFIATSRAMAAHLAPHLADLDSAKISPALISPALISPALISPALISPALISPALISPALAKLLSYGPRRSASDWAEDQRILAHMANEIRALVTRNGFLIVPTAPQSAFALNTPAPANQADFTCIANIAGLPAISFPAGWSSDHMPIGVQIIGQAGHEAGLFDLATSLDKGIAAYRRPANFGY